MIWTFLIGMTDYPGWSIVVFKWIEGNYSALPKGRVETTHKSLPLLRHWNSRKYRSNDTWMAMDLVSLALDDPRKMDIMTFCMRHENQTKLTDSFVSNTHELGAKIVEDFCFLQDNSPFKTMTWRLFWTMQRSQETCETSDAKVVSQFSRLNSELITPPLEINGDGL